MYEPKFYRILSKKKQTEGDYLLKIDCRMRHSPGEFVQCSVLGIGEAPISICSYSEDYIELSVRAVGSVTRAIAGLEEGSLIGIRGPYGRGYPMEHLNGNNVLIIGGGCGIAPLRSVIEHIEKNRADFKEVYLFFGYRSINEVLFREDNKSWAEKFNFNITLDRGDEKWSGNVGLITGLLEKASFDNINKIVFICGPPVMIKFVIGVLKKRGFNDDQIYISAERHMKCGIGKCGHCMIHGKYTCKDGPVFRYDEVKDAVE